ncbi:MAG: hypothetical protein PHV34_07740 [Verrucomicrobiae bacterium]|nr:hypothetical protein [Verrucomicrobiae bacterium]
MNYQSKLKWLGLPLVHVCCGQQDNSRRARGIARGWIAVGDIAFGILFSFGGVAVGGIAIGGASLGLFSIGGLALGLCSIGGLAVGVYAAGGLAVGVWAFGGGAYALRAAYGGHAIAGHYACGGLASAAHANDLAAKNYIKTHWFFSFARWALNGMKYSWLCIFLCLIPVWLNRRKS